MDNIDELVHKYGPTLRELDAHFYNWTHDEDMLFLRWWMELMETGEIKKIMDPLSQRLPKFYEAFAYPTPVLYALDVHGRIEFVSWLRDAASQQQSIFMGNWVRSNLRGRKRHLRLIRVTYELAFSLYENVLGLTWQPALLKLHQKIGYNVIGNIPDYMGQKLVYLLRLNKQDFYRSKLMSLKGG